MFVGVYVHDVAKSFVNNIKRGHLNNKWSQKYRTEKCHYCVLFWPTLSPFVDVAG